MEIEYVDCKKIIYTPKGNWFGVDYNMNIYRGCSHGCIYCDSRSKCYQNINFDKVKVKKNACNIIRNELRNKRKKGVVGIGAMSDPYNPLEKELKLTRETLNYINEYDFGVSLATKSHLVTRDIDILKKIQEKNPVIIKMTITTFDDVLCEKIEPNVSVTSKRFEAIKKLSDEGIHVGILLMPILPFINDNKENIKNIVEAAHKAGAKFIYPSFAVSLRDIQKDYFFECLDKNFPNIKEKYIKSFRNEMWCGPSNYLELKKVFIETCDKYNINYKMNDIVDKYKKISVNVQMDLFDLL